MEKIKKFINSNRRILALAILVIIVILIIVLIVSSLGKKGGILAKSNEEELKTILKDIGKSYYEDFYYNQTGSSDEERVSFVKQFEEMGISSNLETLKLYGLDFVNDNLEKFVNSKTKQACNYENTKIKITPQSPYGKTDYVLEVELDCGFDK